MSKEYNYDHYKSVPDPASNVNFKKKKPKLIAVVDEDNCTGCQVCVPFCPVDCIEPVPKEKYDIPIPPVQVRHDECIGCQICACLLYTSPSPRDRTRSRMPSSA